MIVVTGASGRLGRLVVAGLLNRVPAEQVVAAVRDPGKVADLAGRGVAVRQADYDRPESLAAALEGARRVLLISGTDLGRRVAQHQAVIDAARGAGVELFAYTSALHADTTTLPVGPEHKATEEAIRASGLPYTLLRNGWYNENYVPAAQRAAATGTILGSARDGRIASAARADYAAAAAAVLGTAGHDDTVYELSGDTAWTMTDLAADVASIAGRPVTYQDLPADAYAKALAGAGLPQPVARMFAANDVCIAEGRLATTSGDLSRLIGRPTTPVRDTLAEALT